MVWALIQRKHHHRRNVTSHHFTSLLFTSFHFYVYCNIFPTTQHIPSFLFTSLHFTFMSILTSLALINWTTNTMHISTTQHIPSFLFTSRVLQGFAISAHCFYCWECFELTIGSYFSETSSLHANLFQLSHQTDVLQNLEMRSKVFSFEIFWCYTNGKKARFWEKF